MQAYIKQLAPVSRVAMCEHAIEQCMRIDHFKDEKEELQLKNQELHARIDLAATHE
jgi:hypothetical protein